MQVHCAVSDWMLVSSGGGEKKGGNGEPCTRSTSWMFVILAYRAVAVYDSGLKDELVDGQAGSCVGALLASGWADFSCS